MVGKGIQWKAMVCNDIHWFAMMVCMQNVDKQQNRREGQVVQLSLTSAWVAREKV